MALASVFLPLKDPYRVIEPLLLVCVASRVYAHQINATHARFSAPGVRNIGHATNAINVDAACRLREQREAVRARLAEVTAALVQDDTLTPPWVPHSDADAQPGAIACLECGNSISEAELERSPFLGAVFEGFIAAEIVKAQVNRGRRPEIYYFRDEQGLEVDSLIPGRSGSISLVECKAARTATPAMAAPMQRLAEALFRKRPRGTGVEMFLVHQRPRTPAPTQALLPGVAALPWQEFVKQL
jgi:hypothetical protein